MQRISFNPYDVLGVREHATVEEIKNARRELIKKTPHESHPEEARKINESYHMLIDKVRRSEVDRFLNSKQGSLLEIQKHFLSEKVKEDLFVAESFDFEKDFFVLPKELDFEACFLLNLLDLYIDKKYAG
jgi:DnaJ-class molecular chaperone